MAQQDIRAHPLPLASPIKSFKKFRSPILRHGPGIEFLPGPGRADSPTQLIQSLRFEFVHRNDRTGFGSDSLGHPEVVRVQVGDRYRAKFKRVATEKANGALQPSPVRLRIPARVDQVHSVVGEHQVAKVCVRPEAGELHSYAVQVVSDLLEFRSRIGFRSPKLGLTGDLHPTMLTVTRRDCRMRQSRLWL